MSDALTVDRGLRLPRVSDLRDAVSKSQDLCQHNIQLIREYLRLNPTSAEGHGKLGFVLANVGEFQNAMDEFNRAIELKPRSNAALWKFTLQEQLSFLSQANQCTLTNPSRATALIFRALHKDSQNPAFAAIGYRSLCQIFLREGNYRRAEVGASKGLSYSRDDHTLRMHRARARVKLGKLQEAVDDFTFLSRLQPDDQQVAELLAKYQRMIFEQEQEQEQVQEQDAAAAEDQTQMMMISGSGSSGSADAAADEITDFCKLLATTNANAGAPEEEFPDLEVGSDSHSSSDEAHHARDTLFDGTEDGQFCVVCRAADWTSFGVQSTGDAAAAAAAAAEETIEEEIEIGTTTREETTTRRLPLPLQEENARLLAEIERVTERANALHTELERLRADSERTRLRTCRHCGRRFSREDPSGCHRGLLVFNDASALLGAGPKTPVGWHHHCPGSRTNLSEDGYRWCYPQNPCSAGTVHEE